MLNYSYLNLFKSPASLIIWLVLLIIFITCNVVKADDFLCRVKSVHDGDTFTCSDNRKIRIWGIDTPEVEPKVNHEEAIKNGGYIARDYLKEKLINKNVGNTVICIKKGKSYKRTVAQCYLNNIDIGLMMLKSGYAKEVKRYSKGYYSK